MKKDKMKKIGLVALAAMFTLALPELASAAPTNAPVVNGVTVTDPLIDMWSSLSYYTQTSVGRVITLLIIVGGLAAGIMRQSLWAFVIGVGGGLGLYNAPAIVATIFPALLF